VYLRIAFWPKVAKKQARSGFFCSAFGKNTISHQRSSISALTLKRETKHHFLPKAAKSTPTTTPRNPNKKGDTSFQK
jgi:hypothetical protein